MAKAGNFSKGTSDYLLLREIISSFLLTVGIFSSLSLIFFSSESGIDVRGTMGIVGVFITAILGKAFGVSSFVVPCVAFYLAVLVFRNRVTVSLAGRLASAFLFLISSTAFFGLLFYNESLFGYEPAGGWVGSVLARFLRESLAGTVGSYMIVALLIVTSLSMTVNVTLAQAASFFLRLSVSFSRLSLLVARQMSNGFQSFLRGFVGVVVGASRVFLSRVPSGLFDDGASGNKDPLVLRLNLGRGENPPSTAGVLELPKGSGADSSESDGVNVDEQVNPRETSRALMPLPAIVVDDVPPRVRDERKGVFRVEPLKTDFVLPSIELLDPKVTSGIEVDKMAIYEKASLIERKLADLGISGKVTQIRPGPVITMFEYKPDPGIKINKISVLANDLAMGLSAISVRIVAPIPGKDVIGIEVPNDKREQVVLRELLEDPEFLNSNSILTLALGKDISGRPFYTDLRKAPHLMIAGTTGSGKSVLLNAVITSMLFRATPYELKLLMIDPKMLELSVYDGIPHLLHPVVTEPKEAAAALRWAVREMEERYRLLSAEGVRDIDAYNAKVSTLSPEERQNLWMPYIVVVLDELADLMMVAAREVSESITRLAQKARAAGIHLIVATQRPSVDVVAGLIKANFPARISFLVSSKVDSRIIMDSAGAEQLLGKGDMLFLQPGTFNLIRLQGALISDGERERIASFLRRQGSPNYNSEITVLEDEEGCDAQMDEERDELYIKALEVVAVTGQVSISMLQRKLKIGYNRAARIVELMERDGIVGPQEVAGKPRDLLVDVNQVIERYQN
jgi:S-DNA-T family DNA segregation ATPase FtsK/SpoIIIE